MTIAEQLARFCIDEVPRRLTPPVRHAVERALLDYCGVALAGARMAPIEVMRRALLPGLGTPQGGLMASVLGVPGRTWAPVAALLNGAAAHSIELDDVHPAASLHPAAIVFPTALALAEA